MLLFSFIHETEGLYSISFLAKSNGYITTYKGIVPKNNLEGHKGEKD